MLVGFDVNKDHQRLTDLLRIHKCNPPPDDTALFHFLNAPPARGFRQINFPCQLAQRNCRIFLQMGEYFKINRIHAHTRIIQMFLAGYNPDQWTVKGILGQFPEYCSTFGSRIGQPVLQCGEPVQ